MSVSQSDLGYSACSQRPYCAVDMTVLHQNSNLFQSIRILFEFPAFGGIQAVSTVRTFRLYRYVTSADELIMGLAGGLSRTCTREHRLESWC